MHREGQPDNSRFELMRLGYNEYVPYANSKLYDELFKNLDYERLSAYPAVNGAYDEIAKYLGITKEYIMLTTGSDGGILNTFLTFCNERDKVLIVAPTYGMYYVYADMMNCQSIICNYDDNFELDIDSIISQITEDIKLIALPNPSALTGKSVDEDKLGKLIEKANNTGTVVILDEVYCDFIDYGVSRYISWIQDYDNLVILRSFSKSYGLAGVRAGYILANSKTIEIISHVRQNVEINSIAVEAIKVWCSNKKLLHESIAAINESRNRFCEAMEKIGWAVKNTETNFCMIRIGKENQGVMQSWVTEDKMEIKFMGGSYADYIRITVGTWEYMQPVLERFRIYYERIHEVNANE